MSLPGLPQSRGAERSKYAVTTQNRGASSNATKSAVSRDLPGKTEVIKVLAKRKNVQQSKPFHINVPTRGGGAGRLEYLRPQNNSFNTLSAEELNLAKVNAGLAATKTILEGGIGLLNKYLGSAPASDAPGSNNKMGDGLGNLKIGGHEVISSDATIAAMQKAKTPAELRSAITSARGELKQQEKLDDQQLSKAKEDLQTASKAVKAQEKVVSELSGTIKGCKDSIEKQKGVVANAEGMLSNASDAYKTACNNVTLKETALREAEGRLAGADPNAEGYSELQTAVQKARQQYADALRAQKAALDRQDAAKESYAGAKDTLKTQLEKLAKFEEKLNNVENEKEKADKKLKELQNNESQLKEKIQKHERQVNLETKISEYEAKLNEMVKKSEDEIEQLTKDMVKTQSKINKRTNDIVETDGISGKEQRKLDKNKKDSEVNDSRLKNRNKIMSNLGLESMTTNQTIVFDGHTFTKLENGNFKIDTNGQEYTLDQLKQYIINDND